jgi:predicted small secreted protein
MEDSEMWIKRTNLIPALLAVVALLLLAGCAPRVGAGDVAAASGDDAQLVIDLPALVLDVDEDAQISMGGVPLAELDPGLADNLPIDAEFVKKMMDANIQHIQISPDGDSMTILVNGLEMPTIAYDADSLAAAGVLLDTVGGKEGLEELLPILAQVGLGITLNFPVAEGAEPIPMVVENNEAATMAVAEQGKFLKNVGKAPKITLPITYADDGTWRLSGLGGLALSTLTDGALPQDILVLQPDVIADIKEAGITSMTIATNKDGVHITVHGQDLPTFDWSDGKAANAMTIATALGLLGPSEDAGPVEKMKAEAIMTKVITMN